MLLVHGICLLRVREFAHLQLANFETASVDRVNNLSRLRVTVRFNQSKSALGTLLKLLSREDVGIVNDLKLSGVDNNGRANEELLYGNALDLRASHENPLVLQVPLRVSEILNTYHLDGVVLGIERK